MYVRVIGADEVVRGNGTPDAIRINKLKGKVMKVLGQYPPKKVEVLPGLWLEAEEYQEVEQRTIDELPETFFCEKCDHTFEQTVGFYAKVQCPSCGHEWRA